MLTLTSPVETPLHRLPAGLKLAALCLFAGLLFVLPLWGLGAALLATLLVMVTCGRAFAAQSVRMVWPLWPFVAVLAVWHGWTGDVTGGAAIVLRLITAVMAANLVTMTTRLSDMIAVIETLLRPLSRLGLSSRMVALSIALMIRFIPVLAERTAQLRSAWQARSPRRPGWRILVPVALAALDDADHVAEALRARGGAG